VNGAGRDYRSSFDVRRSTPLLVSMSPRPPFEIRSSPIQGFGAFATRRIPAGTRLVRTVAADADCTQGATLVCTLPAIPAGQSSVVTIVLAGTSVGTTIHHAVTVTPDDLTASVDTLITPQSVAPAPVPLVSPPCANVERGTRDDDVITGTAYGDTIYGLEHSDLLRGGESDDCLWGGEGNDVLDGDGGNDRLWGGNGRDRLLGGDGNDILYGGLKRDVLAGGAGDDQLFPGTGRDIVRAGAGNDVINARDGSRDVIECASGVDRVVADRHDRLRGCEQVARR